MLLAFGAVAGLLRGCCAAAELQANLLQLCHHFGRCAEALGGTSPQKDERAGLQSFSSPARFLQPVTPT